MRLAVVSCLLVLTACDHAASSNAPAPPPIRSEFNAQTPEGEARAIIWHLRAEWSDCGLRMVASPAFQAIKDQFVGLKPFDRAATPLEARHIVYLVENHLRPCREIQLEIAGRTHPSLPPLFDAASTKWDALVARLVRQQITWAEYHRNNNAARMELNNQLEATRIALQLPSLNGLQ